jgi:putative lipase involved disintegration of autophagic bodies
MRTMAVCGKSLTGEGRKDLIYSIVIDPIHYDGCTICEVYGAAVENMRTGEREAVHNITSRFSDILDTVTLISENLVTPVTLRDVIEDLTA